MTGIGIIKETLMQISVILISIVIVLTPAGAFARDIFVHPEDHEYEDYRAISNLMFAKFDGFMSCAIAPMADNYLAVNKKRITKYLRRKKISPDETVVWAWCDAEVPHCFEDDGEQVCFEPRGWSYFQSIKYRGSNRIRAIWRFNYLGQEGSEDAEKIAASNLQYYFLQKENNVWEIEEMFNQLIVDARPDEQKASARALADGIVSDQGDNTRSLGSNEIQ